VDPLDLIDRYGTDALRFTLAALTMPGSDLKLSEARTEGYRHFVNKIWNASRFALMNLGDSDKSPGRGSTLSKTDTPLPDRWIRGRLNQTIREVRKAMEEYKFNEASHSLYHFVWHQFCDWYVELIKPALYQDQDLRRKTLSQETLLEVLDATLRLLHPFMPFVTEEIWQQLPLERKTDSIMIAPFPVEDESWDDDHIAEEMEKMIEIITAIRNIRGEMNVPPGEQIKVFLRPKDRTSEEQLREVEKFIQVLAKVNKLTISGTSERPPFSAFAEVRGVEIFVPMDRSRMEGEILRLQKEMGKIEKDIAFVRKKLSNEQFVSKAPPEVVEEEKEKALQYQTLRQKLEESIRRIKETLS
jgi:valyl-tRNA synthetase